MCFVEVTCKKAIRTYIVKLSKSTQGIIIMTHTQQPPSQQPSKKSTHKKILIICGIILGVIILVVAGILFYSDHAIREFKKEYTEDKPVEIHHEPITKTQQTKLATKYNSVKDVVKNHKKAELQFTSEELSQMLAFSPETKKYASQSKFWLEGDKIKADLSVSLDRIPHLKGRYLNGLFTFSVQVKDGKIHYHVDECLVKGQPVNPMYLKLLNSQNVENILMQHSRTSNWNEFIESVEVKDGKLTIKTR